MKKLVLLLTLGIFATGLKAQTKEETIQWLKEKLVKCITLPHNYSTNLKIETINECEIVFTYSENWSDNRTHYFTQAIPTDIQGIDREGHFFCSSKLIALRHNTDEAKFYDRSDLKLDDREDNIRERVKKALTHLATFCPKKKEIF